MKTQTRKGTKMMFYTPEELKELTNAINMGTHPLVIATNFVAHHPKRTKDAVAQKVNVMITKMKNAPMKEAEVRVIKAPKVKSPQQEANIEVELPDGFQFNGQPKRVTLTRDHFRIYF